MDIAPPGLSPTAALPTTPPDSDWPLSLVNSASMFLMAFIKGTCLRQAGELNHLLNLGSQLLNLRSLVLH